MVRGEGEARVGSRLRLTMMRGEGKEFTFRATVEVARPGAHLVWLGGLRVPKIFDGRHEFVLTPTNDGTHMQHFETFTGVLPPLMRSLAHDAERSFLAWNNALAARVASVRLT